MDVEDAEKSGQYPISRRKIRGVNAFGRAQLVTVPIFQNRDREGAICL